MLLLAPAVLCAARPPIKTCTTADAIDVTFPFNRGAGAGNND
jgi:hypothetical protein